MIINSSYFIGEIHLSQVGAGASTKVNSNDKFQIFVDEYEREIINKGLGKQLADEFYSNIDSTTGELLPGADAKWDRLLNGHTYTKSNLQYYWQGLISESGTFKSSLMAYYVYFYYILQGATQQSTMGILKADAENSKTASATPKMVKAWRKMYDWYSGDNNHYHPYNIQVKNRIVFTDYYGDGNREVSLYTFIKDNESDYDNWVFTPIANRNQFDI